MCIQSVTVVLDEDVSHQITLTREGDVIIGINAAASLPYVDGTGLLIPIVIQGRIRVKKWKTNQISSQKVACVDTLPPLCVLDIFNDRGFLMPVSGT